LPCKPQQKSVDVYVEVMKMIASSNNRSEIEDKLRVKYPLQVIKAQQYAAEFFGGYPAF